jgi:hypothetical protein
MTLDAEDWVNDAVKGFLPVGGGPIADPNVCVTTSRSA